MVATSAGLTSLKGIWANSEGDIYFADSHRLRVVDSVTDIVSIVAGTVDMDTDNVGSGTDIAVLNISTGVCGSECDSMTVYVSNAGSDKDHSGGAVYAFAATPAETRSLTDRLLTSSTTPGNADGLLSFNAIIRK